MRPKLLIVIGGFTLEVLLFGQFAHSTGRPSVVHVWVLLLCITLTYIGLAMLWTAYRCVQFGYVSLYARFSATREWAWYGYVSFTTLSFIATLYAHAHIGINDSGIVISLANFPLAIIFLAAALNGVQFREGGIIVGLTTVHWREVRGYEWSGQNGDKLTLHIEPSLWRWRQSRISIPLRRESRADVDEALSTAGVVERMHIPAYWT
jgi:hypothetical protein